VDVPSDPLLPWEGKGRRDREAARAAEGELLPSDSGEPRPGPEEKMMLLIVAEADAGVVVAAAEEAAAAAMLVTLGLSGRTAGT
jgi:hypothetical protein